MNVCHNFSRCARWLLLSGLIAEPAMSASIDISAVFRPDPAKPMQNSFENTTPAGGYCKDHPSYCENGVFSLALPIRFKSVAPIAALHSERQGPMFRVPSHWQDVTVIHENTGETETVRMRVNGIGAAYTIKNPLPEGVWQSGWVNAPAPCQYGGVGYGNAWYYAFFWRVPVNEGVCSKQAQKAIDQSYEFAYQETGFSYELMTPNPLKMSSGTYRGILNYTVGPRGDFDMGDVMEPDDPTLTLNFNLDVQHTLKVDIPPGGDKVQLVPAGGWQSWLQAGRKPVRLFRDQTFNISASSRFKMYLDCQFGPGRSCYLDDGKNVFVPIEVSVSLPAGLMDSSGRPVSRQVLKVGEMDSVVFQPSQYVDRKPGTLHFELHKDAIDVVLLPQTGKHYRGSVVVVWDSEV